MKNNKSIEKIIINIILFAFLFIMVFILFLCPRDWIYTDTYSDDVTDVIRFISLCEVVISIALVTLNKRKMAITVLILTNAFTLYKFISTFITL